VASSFGLAASDLGFELFGEQTSVIGIAQTSRLLGQGKVIFVTMGSRPGSALLEQGTGGRGDDAERRDLLGERRREGQPGRCPVGAGIGRVARKGIGWGRCRKRALVHPYCLASIAVSR
jgi:hypothetical protein